MRGAELVAEDLMAATAADADAAIAAAVFLGEDAREEEELVDAVAAEAAIVTRKLRNRTCTVHRMPMTASRDVPLRRIMLSSFANAQV
jgi:hypothetical protein